MVKITPEMCIAGRELGEPRLSPDARTVAFSVGWGGRSAIAVVPVDGGVERLLTTEPQPRSGRGFGGGCFDWLPDSSGVVYAARDGGLWLQPAAGGAPRCIVEGDPDRPAQAPAVSPDAARVAYVVDQAEVWCTSLVEEQASAVRLSAASTDFCADPAWAPGGATVVWQEWDVPNMAWDESRLVRAHVHHGGAEVIAAQRSVQMQQPRWSPDGRLFWVSDATGWLVVHCDGSPVLDEQYEHAGPTWGLGQRSFAISPDGARVALCRNEAGFGRLVVVDLGRGEVEEIATAVHGQLSWHGDRLTALRSGARTPTQIVSYDLARRPVERRTLGVGPVLGFEDAELPEPELVSWPAEDGAEVFGRLYRSPGHGSAAGRLLCWVHGGPTDQWQVVFMPRHCYWLHQGWSILVPDHRGSTGHGRAYQQAMAGRWGELDVSDVADALRHAHAQGWATPATTVLVGGSAGGFTALNVLIAHPGLVAGAVVLYPVTDLAELDATTHRYEAHYNRTLVGPSEVAPARYEQRSPLRHAERIDAPLLVLHGTDDPVVALSQSEALRDRVWAAGGDVELHVYEGEGHGFRQPANQLDEYRRMADFLRRVVP